MKQDKKYYEIIKLDWIRILLMLLCLFIPFFGAALLAIVVINRSDLKGRKSYFTKIVKYEIKETSN